MPHDSRGTSMGGDSRERKGAAADVAADTSVGFDDQRLSNRERRRQWRRDRREREARKPESASKGHKKKTTKHTDRSSVFVGLDPAVLGVLNSPSFLALKAELVLKYDQGRYPFRKLVHQVMCEGLGLPVVDSFELENLHTVLPGFSAQSSCKAQKQKLLQPLFTVGSAPHRKLNALFDAFVCEVVAPHLALAMDSAALCTSRVLYGKLCIRVQPPSTTNIGSAHCDAEYKHQPGQINFWVPLTAVFGTNSLFVESSPGQGDFHAFEGNAGDCFRFYGMRAVACMHACMHACVRACVPVGVRASTPDRCIYVCTPEACAWLRV